MAEMAGELSQLAAKIERIGGVLDDAAATVDIVGALERKLDRLAETIAANAASTGGDPVDEQALADIRDRLDRLHEALASAPRGSQEVPEAIERKLDQLAEALAANAAATGGRGDDETLAEIRDRLDQLQAALDNTARNAPMAIERSMLLLVDKLDRIQALVAGGGELHADLKSDLQADLRSDLGALATRLDQIVERLDQSDGRGGQFEAIERGLNDLFAQLEETRFSAIDAVRAAVRDAGAGPVEDLIRDLSDLRTAQRSTELKTHDTLESVHGTLERVIDRLAMLEEDLARRGEASPEEPPVPTPAPCPAPSGTVPPLAAPPQPAALAAQPPATGPAAELAPELPPDHPLEPGSRAPRLRAWRARAAARPRPGARGGGLRAGKAGAGAQHQGQLHRRRTAGSPAGGGGKRARRPRRRTPAAPGGLRGAIARHRTLILALLLLVAVAAGGPAGAAEAAAAVVGCPGGPAGRAGTGPRAGRAARGARDRNRACRPNQIIAQVPSSGLLSPDSTAGVLRPRASAGRSGRHRLGDPAQRHAGHPGAGEGGRRAAGGDRLAGAARRRPGRRPGGDVRDRHPLRRWPRREPEPHPRRALV